MDLTSKYREEVALILIKAGVEYLETAVAWLHFSAVTANKSPWKRNPAIFPNRQKGRRKTENRFPWLICGKFGLIRKPGKVFSRFLDINVRRVNTRPPMMKYSGRLSYRYGSNISFCENKKKANPDHTEFATPLTLPPTTLPHLQSTVPPDRSIDRGKPS